MKPCRILGSYKSSSLLRFSPTTKFNDQIMGKSTLSIHSHRYHPCKTHFVGYIPVSVINLNQRDSFSISDSKWVSSRIFSTSCSLNVVGSDRNRFVSLETDVASDIRNHSTSVDSHVSHNGFENIYIQSGLNVKPLVIERIETDPYLSWSYHNGGSWPSLVWQFTLACIKMGRPYLAQKAVDLAEKRLSTDEWPEYYDGQNGRFIGKQSRLRQTWTIAGFLTSKMLIQNPEKASLLFLEEDLEILQSCVCLLIKSGTRNKCSRFAAQSQIVVQ